MPRKKRRLPKVLIKNNRFLSTGKKKNRKSRLSINEREIRIEGFTLIDNDDFDEITNKIFSKIKEVAKGGKAMLPFHLSSADKEMRKIARAMAYAFSERNFNAEKRN